MHETQCLITMPRNVEYHPMLFRQHEGLPHVEMESLNKVRLIVWAVCVGGVGILKQECCATGRG